jgi:hypothetical protein
MCRRSRSKPVTCRMQFGGVTALASFAPWERSWILIWSWIMHKLNVMKISTLDLQKHSLGRRRTVPLSVTSFRKKPGNGASYWRQPICLILNFNDCRYYTWLNNVWSIPSSGIKRRVVRWKSTDVSEKYVASMFMVEAQLGNWFVLISCMAYTSTLKMEATCFSETSVHFRRTTRRYIL